MCECRLGRYEQSEKIIRSSLLLQSFGGNERKITSVAVEGGTHVGRDLQSEASAAIEGDSGKNGILRCRVNYHLRSWVRSFRP